MLQIYVYGPREEGFLEVDPSTVLQMEILADVFDEDLSVGEFSLPVEVPWTERNRRILGFAERIENFSSKQKTFRCIVYDNNFPEIPSGKFTILEKSGNFSYLKGKFNATISGNKGLFGSQIANKKMTELTLGGKIDWSADLIDSRTFATRLMKGQYPQYNYIGFAPVGIENFIDTARQDFSTEFLAKDTVNNVVAGTLGADAWAFARPRSNNPTQIADPGEHEYVNFRTVPFFNLQYVIKKLFEQFGYKVSGNLVDDPAFTELFLFNNFSLERYYLYPGYTDFTTSITPADHMPDVLVAEWLKGVFAFFNVYPIFRMNNEVHLLYRANEVRDRQVLNLSGVVDIDFTATSESIASENGYTLKYVWDSNDGYYSDRVKDLADKTLVATVAMRSNLDTLDIGRPMNTDDIAYVQADNLYYRVADATTVPVLWDAYAEELREYVSGAGEKSIDCNLSTLARYVTFNNTTGLYEPKNYVGTRQQGSYVNDKGIRVKAEFGIRIFYIQRQLINGVNVPVSFSNNRNAANVRTVPYSLAWQGEDGMAINFHVPWQTTRERADIIKTKLRADQKVLADCRRFNCYEIDNVLYLPYKTENEIPLGNELEVWLVPI